MNFNLILSVAMFLKTICVDAGLDLNNLTAIAKATIQVHPIFFHQQRMHLSCAPVSSAYRETRALCL